MESEAKRYEISYLVSPNVAEDDVVRVAGIVTRLIEEAKGVVGHINEPKKRRLFYPIRRERFAYFGYTTFRVDPAAASEISKKLKFEKEILRHLIVEEVIIPPRQFAFRASWQPSEVAAGVKREAPRREATPALSLEERAKAIESIDKKLDEILGVPAET
ncbi:MAG: 30S ribosomal protein S6 [Parcubacteria group bacterium GW2011_GWB1_52_7]|nr:MAG: 30S ribosomal protein S6 [Parcubacteria group bacterium GW2011_GWB1_52_7]KKW30530.1 MAG: 30S ribosomal protein S6 [Parcubacteria group bacterium GW2011_GWC2_52_8c]